MYFRMSSFFLLKSRISGLFQNKIQNNFCFHIEYRNTIWFKDTLRCNLTTNKNLPAFFKAKIYINSHTSFLWVHFLQVVWLRTQVTLSPALIQIGVWMLTDVRLGMFILIEFRGIWKIMRRMTSCVRKNSYWKCKKKKKENCGIPNNFNSILQLHQYLCISKLALEGCVENLHSGFPSSGVCILHNDPQTFAGGVSSGNKSPQ